jgi:predicted dehydrogenase
MPSSIKNETVGIGILGAGNISELCVRGYVDDQRCKVVAICDTDIDKAKSKALRWGVETIYSDIDDFLNDERIDAVEILTPTYLHHDHVIKVSEAKKHISCQKPIANTVTDGREMVKAAESADIIFRINECFYHYPPLEKAKHHIQKGHIGTPQQVRVHTLVGQTDSKFQAMLEAEGYTWRLNQNSPGGHIFDDIVHKIAVSQWLVDQKIVNLSSTLLRMHTFFEPFVALLEYENRDLIGMLDSTYAENMWLNSSYYGADEFIEIIGDEGFIWVTRCTGEMLNLAPLVLYDGKNNKKHFEHFNQVDSDWGTGFKRSASYFIDSITNKKDLSISPMMTPDDAINVLQICFAIYKSAQTGTKVDPRTIDDFVISPGGYP